MANIKWSAFPNGSTLVTGDQLVGLRAGANVRLTPVTPHQVQSLAFNTGSATGVNDAFVVTLVPTPTALTDGMIITMDSAALVNFTSNPTLQVNAFPPKDIVTFAGGLAPGDIQAGTEYLFIYSLSNDNFQLINPFISTADTFEVQANGYNYALDTGVVNAYIANILPAPISSINSGFPVFMESIHTNTGASTLTVQGFTAPIVLNDGSALTGGEILINEVCFFVYNSTYAAFQLVASSAGGGAVTIDGDTGFATGSTINLISDVAAINCGSSVEFVGNNTSTITLNVTDVNQSTYIGLQSGNAAVSGIQNVGLGFQSLQSLTTGRTNVAIGGTFTLPVLTTGSFNVAIGGAALQQSVADSNNVAIGVDALSGLNGGSNNTAVGWSALGDNNGAFSNLTAVGYYALAGTTSSTNATAVGYNALGTSQADDDNTAVGYQALMTLNGGLQNTAVGSNALTSSTNGSNNVALGWSSLGVLTNGSNNTAIGTQAMHQATTAADNTSVGLDSLFSATSATQNAALGWGAFYSLLTGSNNAGLGYLAGSNFNSSESSSVMINHAGLPGDNNTLRIGQATGAGAQELNSAYIQGIYSNTQPVSGTVEYVTIDNTTGLLGVTTSSGTSTSTTLVASTPYAVLLSDDIILVDTASIAGPSSIVLPPNPPTDGQVWTVKDWSGTAGTNPITVTVFGGADTIDGASSYVLSTNYESVGFVFSVGQGTYSVVYDADAGGSGTVTVAGDTGSITGNSLTIYADTAGNNCGSSVSFVNSGTTSTLNVTDAGQSIYLGNLCGNTSVAAIQCVGMGYLALNSLTNGRSNTSIGYESMQNLTTGTFNVALGQGALQVSVADNNNTAVGLDAMSGLNGGSNNTAVGWTALGDNVGAFSNLTAVGYYALANTASSTNATAVGYNALSSSQADSDNTAVGNQVLSALNGGNNNTALGSNALISLAAGSNNTAVGQNALSLSTADGDNTAIGYSALGHINGGTGNVGLGEGTGGSCVTGSYNVFAGINSGNAYSGAESNNVILNSFGVNGESNTLRIGDSTGTGTIQLNAAYIQGIYGNTQPISGTVEFVTIDNTTGLLGVTTTAAGSVTIAGDSGTITGNSLTIYADVASFNCGSSVNFTNSGTISTLNLTDPSNNTFLGLGCGTIFTNTFVQNTIIGVDSANVITTASYNSGVGVDIFDSLTTGQNNSCLGINAHSFLVTGNNNTALGANAGYNLIAAESDNIHINSQGVNGDNNILRIGDTTGTGTYAVNAAYIQGIYSNSQPTSATVEIVTIDNTTGLLGVTSAATAITWSDHAVSFSAAANNGYIATAALTATLPIGTVAGQTISFITDTAGSLIIQANTGQFIRLGAVISSSAGTATSASRGDCLTLIYSDSSSTWIANSAIGNAWLLA